MISAKQKVGAAKAAGVPVSRERGGVNCNFLRIKCAGSGNKSLRRAETICGESTSFRGGWVNQPSEKNVLIGFRARGLFRVNFPREILFCPNF
jgi:hypothetical protein